MNSEDRANPSNDPPPSVRRLVDHIEAAIAAGLADAEDEADLDLAAARAVGDLREATALLWQANNRADLATVALQRIQAAAGFVPVKGSTSEQALDELVEHVRRLAAAAASPLLHLDAETGRVTKVADAPPYRGRGPLLAWVEADRVAAARALRDVLGEVRAWPPLTSIEVDDERAVIAVYGRAFSNGSLHRLEFWTTEGNDYTAGPAQLWTFVHEPGGARPSGPLPVVTGRELAARLADLAAEVRR